ncbi:transketolase [Lachnospiraceae bacterium]|nr:transketolase [Lachnospiraceae bacterium]
METKELAKRIRKHAVEMTHASHASHIGSVLSIADIVAVLYNDVLHYHASEPRWEDRDRLVLSKGHAGIAIYAALAECGFFSVSELEHYYQDGSPYSGHVSHKGVPGVEISTGSLGHGAAMACGIALSGKAKKKDYHVYTIVGDGECEEGVIWETAMIACQQHLDNFTIIVDANKMQGMGDCKDATALYPLTEKWESFGFYTINVEDGNDITQLQKAFKNFEHGRPRCVIANTVKGKGISFMENDILWHFRDPQGEQYEQAVRELEALR